MTEQLDLYQESVAIVLTGILTVMALIYLLMAFGLRRGDMVWSGRYPRRLPPELRRRSLIYAVLLVVSAGLLLAIAGVMEIEVIASQWMTSIGFVVTAFLGLSGLVSLANGSAWERFLFAPVLLAAAALSGLITFG